MLTSKELRTKAWESLKGKYWIAFAASLITGILASISSGASTFSTNLIKIPATVDVTKLDSVMQTGAVVIASIAAGVSILGLIWSIFVSIPVSIGSCNFFIKNTDSKPAISEIFSGFKTKYMRNIGTMILVSIKTFLWTLLFIVPGIIKSFEYAIIPYILADNSEITYKEAFAKAKEMMTGNKWRLFKLEFSFIGWALLCIPTFGIGVFFLAPYMEAALAEFYVELKNN